jgi:capsular polysaccharide biosynthesis protein
VSAERPPQAGTLLWGLRNYAWVAILCALALAAVPLIVKPAAPTYQADALIFVRQLSVDSRILPRLAESVFANGAVADRVAEDPAIGDSSGLIPDQLSVVAAEDSIVFVVQARHTDPATAARLADLGASALVEELNRPGAGIGEFALQDDAVVPTETLSAMSAVARSAIGALAGLVIGLGLIALITAIRRPVVTAQDVQGIAGVPLLGTVQLPVAAEGTYPGPLGVRGIANVTRWLATVPPGRLLLVSPPSTVGIRRRVFVMVAAALWTLRPVRFEGPQGLIAAIRQHCLDHRDAGRAVQPRAEARDELVLVDGGSPLEIVDPTVTNVSAVAIAPLGIPRNRLRALTLDYADGGLIGVILVDVRTGRRATAPPAPEGAPVPDHGRDQDSVAAAREPERA